MAGTNVLASRVNTSVLILGTTLWYWPEYSVPTIGTDPNTRARNLVLTRQESSREPDSSSKYRPDAVSLYLVKTGSPPLRNSTALNPY